MSIKANNEVEKTLQLFDDSRIEVNSMFADQLSGRIADMRASRRIYRSSAFYPAVIVLLIVLNISACMFNFAGHDNTDNEDYQVSVMASEYSIGTSDLYSN